jgi:HSP20 family protein
MYLTRRSTDGLPSLRRLNSLLDEVLGTWPSELGTGAITSAWLPACDISEDHDAIRIVAEIPGVKPEDVKLSIENNVLTIRGEKQQQAESSDERVHRYERSYGSFERTFSLPSTVDADRIEANYDNGLLTIVLPKAERARPREIPVKQSAGSIGSGAGEKSSGQRQTAQQAASR